MAVWISMGEFSVAVLLHNFRRYIQTTNFTRVPIAILNTQQPRNNAQWHVNCSTHGGSFHLLRANVCVISFALGSLCLRHTHLMLFLIFLKTSLEILDMRGQCSLFRHALFGCFCFLQSASMQSSLFFVVVFLYLNSFHSRDGFVHSAPIHIDG